MTDTIATMPSQHNYFYFYTPTSLSISNAFISSDGSKPIWIDYATDITIASVTISLENWLPDSSKAVVDIYCDSYYLTTIATSNIQIICDSSPMAMSQVFSSKKLYAAYHSNITVSNCDFNKQSSSSQYFIISTNPHVSVFDNITFDNVTFGSYSSQILIEVTGNPTMSVSTISNINIVCSAQKMVMQKAIDSNTLLDVYYANITVTNCDFSNFSALSSPTFIYASSPTTSAIDNVTFNNVTAGNDTSQTLIWATGSYSKSVSNISNIQITCSSLPMAMPWAIYTFEQWVCIFSNQSKNQSQRPYRFIIRGLRKLL